ncbi:FeoB small GTPase domain-containing protein [Geobacillus sp. C56-T2]|uniref:FeoB small GTPase domain-containing protein n=1 Tax=Geobacillus sp. C56-T2 TaxID=600773 RepID=UPI0011A694EB|nr:FeoB small GTPase domain-containing protein [Geobacillus sp. C56-T2]NNV06239.1 GTP-binding protein [Geobacillus sp. MMMUD3]TWG30298.1 small GTP-binding protein [Geobacillus sp. C56-T2]
MTRMNYTIALMGNPNTGKSTLFNVLTGLRQHTGNWPGKTVIRAEGEFTHRGATYRIVDLPGTYSLYSNSADEEVARDFLLFERPDLTIVVVDATALERNLNLALQVLEITDRVIVAVNLMDEANKKGILINSKKLENKLGVPVVPISARNKEGIDTLVDTVDAMVRGRIKTNPLSIRYSSDIEQGIARLIPRIRETVGDAYPARWIALRLLDGDTSLLAALKQPPQRDTKEEGAYACCGSVKSI